MSKLCQDCRDNWCVNHHNCHKDSELFSINLCQQCYKQVPQELKDKLDFINKEYYAAKSMVDKKYRESIEAQREIFRFLDKLGKYT